MTINGYFLFFLLLIDPSDAVLQRCASVQSLSNDSKLAEMILTRGMKLHLDSGIGNLFEIQIACLSLYRHNIENLVTNTHTHTRNKKNPGDTEHLHKPSSMKEDLHMKKKTEQST